MSVAEVRDERTELELRYAAMVNNAIAEGRESQIRSIVKAFEAERDGKSVNRGFFARIRHAA